MHFIVYIQSSTHTWNHLHKHRCRCADHTAAVITVRVQWDFLWWLCAGFPVTSAPIVLITVLVWRRIMNAGFVANLKINEHYLFYSYFHPYLPPPIPFLLTFAVLSPPILYPADTVATYWRYPHSKKKEVKNRTFTTNKHNKHVGSTLLMSTC